MNTLELELLQANYTSITEQITKLKKAQTKLKKTGTDAGFRLQGSKFVKDKEVFGIFFDLTYYSHFDGHASGAVNEYSSGAFESNEKTFNFIKNLIETGNFGEEEELYMMLEEIQFDDCGYLEIPYNGSPEKQREKFRSMFKKVSPTEIKWSYKGRRDQGEYRDGSGFTIRLATQSEIKKVKWDSGSETD